MTRSVAMGRKLSYKTDSSVGLRAEPPPTRMPHRRTPPLWPVGGSRSPPQSPRQQAHEQCAAAIPNPCCWRSL